MLYTVDMIAEDLDFGCEERPEGAPVLAVVSMHAQSGERLTVRMPDQLLYERNIEENDLVCFDEENLLQKVIVSDE